MRKYSGNINAAMGVTAAGITQYLPTFGEAKQRIWQDKVLEYANTVPEVAGAASLVNNSVRRIKLKGVNAIASSALSEFDLPLACELMFLTSEAYIVYNPVDKKFRVYSHKQLKRNPDMSYSVLNANGKFDSLPQNTQVTWVHRPSRENTNVAWNPHMAAVDIMEALYNHQLADNAVATSRLATAGFLVWPTDRQSKPQINGEPQKGSQEELARDFGNSMRQNVASMRDSGAYAPFLHFVDVEDSDKSVPSLVRIEREDYADNYTKRIETYRLRYASAIDLPIEQVTGIGQTNNWSGFMIRDDAWKVYLSPIIDIVINGLRQALVKAGFAGAEEITIDPNELVQKPDNTATILRLLQLKNIEPAYALELLGYDKRFAIDHEVGSATLKQMSDIPPVYKMGGERGDRSMNNAV